MAKRWISFLLLTVLLLGLLAGCKQEQVEDDQVETYNATITAAARKAGKISDSEFVLIDTVTQGKSGNVDITIRVYRMAEGQKQADYMHLRVSDVPEDFAPEFMGTGTARLVGGSLQSIVITVNFVR